MIAKVIAWGADRATALARLQRALARTEVAGVVTNVGFLQAVLAHTRFAAGVVDTAFIDPQRAVLVPAEEDVPERVLAAAALAEIATRDRKSGVSGQGVSVRGDLGCRRII